MRKILALALGVLLTLAVALPAVAAGPAGVLGVVTDENGSPIANAEVEFYRLDDGLVTLLATDAGGRFQLDRQPAAGEMWQLRGRAPGYRTAETGWIELGRSRYQSLKLAAIAGELLVQVQDWNGQPVAGFDLTVISAGGTVWEKDVAGAGFALKGLLAGDYRVLVSAPGYLSASHTATVMAGRKSAASITVEQAGLVATGEVKSAVTGAPLSGATVSLLRADQSRAAAGVSDAAGHFRLSLAQGAGETYQLQVSAPGYRSAVTATFTATPGHDLDFSGGAAISLQPVKGTITGILMRNNGDYLANLPVVLERKGYGKVAETVTSDRGELRFDDVIAGPDVQYRLTINRDYHSGDTPWAPILPGVNNQVALTTRVFSANTDGMGSVGGLVVDPAGAPVAGAQVELINRWYHKDVAVTRDDGTFLIDAVPAPLNFPGATVTPYMLRVSKAGYVTTSEITIGGDFATEVPVTKQNRTITKTVLYPSVSNLTGRVVDNRGRGVGNATVWVRADGGLFEARAETDAAGWYKVVGAPSGSAYHYTIAAEATGYFPVEGVALPELTAASQGLPTLALTPVLTAVAGRVQSPDGTPQAGVAVKLFGLGKECGRAVTDEGGFYRIAAEIPRLGGAMSLQAATDWGTYGSELSQADVTAAAGGTLSRDLTVLVPASLTGRVLTADGQPRPGVDVQLVEEGGIALIARTDENGIYSFPTVVSAGTGLFWLRTGPNEVRKVSLPGQAGVVSMVRLSPGRQTIQDLLVKE
ncbi:MAG TPA: carboxypeptidase-like regulatory domain-containing protein [Symbiobacteriaceae bacterium]|nr:carboxypeptidase-like regulatory domain-containing protein [Symbiobacteriaceae bacterium]